MRTVLAVGLVVAATVTLAGCSRSASTGSDAAGTIASGKATGTLNVWAQGTEAQFLPTIVKGFEKANPKVTVKITALPWGAAFQKYQTAIAGGSTPDVAQMGTTWMPNFATAFEPTPAAVDTSDMFSGAKKVTVVGGTSVGVPWYVDTRVIYYRKDLAAKAGYSTPPTTWDGLQAMAKAMQTKAGAQYGIALATGAAADDFQAQLPFVWSNGASLTNAAGTKWTLDTPAVVGAMKYVNSFFTEGIANRNPGSAVGGLEANFVSGNTPMMVNSPAEVSALETAGGGMSYSSKIGVMRFPTKVSSTSFVGGSDLAVFKNSKNRSSAWKLVQYLSEPSVQAEFYKLTGDLPSVQSAWDLGTLKSDARLKVFKSQLTDTNAPPSVTSWVQVSAAADSALQQIVRGGVTPDAALQALQTTADGVGITK
ncbi:MAG: extracellular solute-binding protein [Leifsonia sp.]